MDKPHDIPQINLIRLFQGTKIHHVVCDMKKKLPMIISFENHPLPREVNPIWHAAHISRQEKNMRDLTR